VLEAHPIGRSARARQAGSTLAALGLLGLCGQATTPTAQPADSTAPQTIALEDCKPLSNAPSEGQACDPAQPSAPCSVSGLRVDERGTYWIVRDRFADQVAQIPQLKLGASARPLRLERGEDTPTLDDLEALTFTDGGKTLVVGSDTGELAWLDVATRHVHARVRADKPAGLTDNEGFEAIFAAGPYVYAIFEKPDGTGHYTVDAVEPSGVKQTLRFTWDAAPLGCERGKALRITDALEHEGGAYMLASCSVGAGRYAYALGELRPITQGDVRAPATTGFVIEHSYAIRNDAQLNLEGLAYAGGHAGKRLLVINDDDFKVRTAATVLCALKLP